MIRKTTLSIVGSGISSVDWLCQQRFEVVTFLRGPNWQLLENGFLGKVQVCGFPETHTWQNVSRSHSRLNLHRDTTLWNIISFSLHVIFFYYWSVLASYA
jgi:hypothetical protein